MADDESDDEFWEPFISDFSHLFHPTAVATLLLNTSSKPQLPDHLWRYIFSFIQRKDFLPTRIGTSQGSGMHIMFDYFPLCISECF